jgi:hypothetical protein
MADKSVWPVKATPVLSVVGNMSPEINCRIMLETPKSLFRTPRVAESMLDAVCDL